MTDGRPFAEYKIIQAFLEANESNRLATICTSFPPPLRELVRDCLRVPPDARPTAEQFMQRLYGMVDLSPKTLRAS
jgi:hypothetical protein